MIVNRPSCIKVSDVQRERQNDRHARQGDLWNYLQPPESAHTDPPEREYHRLPVPCRRGEAEKKIHPGQPAGNESHLHRIPGWLPVLHPEHQPDKDCAPGTGSRHGISRHGGGAGDIHSPRREGPGGSGEPPNR